jgi:serine O-acetyltransferase
MEQEFLSKLYKTHQDCPGCPSPKVVVSFFDDILGTLFPDFSKQQFNDLEQFNHHYHLLKNRLKEILARNPLKGIMNTEIAAEEFFRILPSIYEKLKEDIEAMFAGDPAAKSRTEVVRTYPGFYAIASYRIAHALHKLDIKLIPRIITENAHSRTGIDIHPSAEIGHHFCIDHGTGVVIGETTNIGNYVKIYQGVTLGALSVNKEDAAVKRHPSIGDHVVIYAGATILGGKTHIGSHSVIGGNVWLTRSVPDHSKIYYQANMMNSQTGETDLIIFKEHE